MNHNDKIKEILSNLSGNKIREIEIVSGEIEGRTIYYVKASIKTKIVGVLLDAEEKDSFIRKLSEHSWHILYKGFLGLNDTMCQERYFHITDIERIAIEYPSILKIEYKNTLTDITRIIFGNLSNEIQQTIDSLEKAGRYDLLLQMT